MSCSWIRPRLAVFAVSVLACGTVRAEGPEESKKVYTVTREKPKGEEIDLKLDLNKSDKGLNPEREISLKETIELLEKGEIEEIRQDKPPSFLALRWDLGLWSLIVFLGLLFILNKVAWKPMLEGLRNREDNIRRALEDAEQAKKETAELRQKLQSEMDKAQEMVRQTIEEGRRDAQRTADDVLAKAKADIQAERERLKREMDLARDQAIKELWEQTAQLATQVSTKAVGREMNLDDHRRLVDEALAEMRRAAGNGKAQ
jgi:F-type H+-transporting ATPase subunit b